MHRHLKALGIAALLAAIALPAVTSGVGASTVYYVSTTGSDSASGSSTSPWRTIQHAVNVAAGGSTIFVRGGWYGGFSTSRGWLRVARYASERVVVSAAKYNVIYLGGATGFTIDGLEVTGANQQYGAGIRVSGASSVTIRNVNLHDNRSFGLEIDNSPGFTVQYADIHNNETGIQLSGSTDSGLIENSRIHDHSKMVSIVGSTTKPGSDDRGANGIVFYHTQGRIVVRNSSFYANRAYSPRYGRDGGGFEIYGSSNISIDRITSYDEQNVMETGAGSGYSCWNNSFTHSTAYGSIGVAAVPGPSEGLILRCANNMIVAQNTFDRLSRFALDITNSGTNAGGISGLKVLNDIAVGTDHVLSIDSALPSSVQIDHSVVYNPSGGSIAYVAGRGNTGALATLRSWINRMWAGRQGNPLWVSPGAHNYALSAGSPAINLGVTGYDSTYCGSAPDAGRFEYC